MKPEFSIAGRRLYPHLKLTREPFPRLLATRRIADDGAEYFGAFLPETRVRLLIDFLNKTFRLRACEIDVDGSFDVPCTQFYRQRCLAPCVESLCDAREYAAQTELVRLFLAGDAGELERRLLAKIEAFAAAHDFETAAVWRDALSSIARIFEEKDWHFRLDDATDTFRLEETEEFYTLFLVTMRGRRTLGRRVYAFAKAGSADELCEQFLNEFYRFHAPKEIRSARDFAGRRELAETLSRRFGRPVVISVARASDPKILTARALERTRYEHEFRQIRREKTVSEMQTDLQLEFDLPELPARAEAFDVAHISGKDFVAARSVWENGVFLAREYEFRFSDAETELETLRLFIESRFSRASAKTPSLVLIDGGRAHLQAALKALENLPERKFRLVAAVKPRGRHGEISHFLTEEGARIDFEGENAAHRLLQILRDEAHDLSNEIHRQRREMSHFYELARALPALDEGQRRRLLKKYGSLGKLAALGERDLQSDFPPAQARRIALDLDRYRRNQAAPAAPLIVPLRYTDENGDAQDLQPLASYRTK